MVRRLVTLRLMIIHSLSLRATQFCTFDSSRFFFGVVVSEDESYKSDMHRSLWRLQANHLMCIFIGYYYGRCSPFYLPNKWTWENIFIVGLGYIFVGPLIGVIFSRHSPFCTFFCAFYLLLSFKF